MMEIDTVSMNDCSTKWLRANWSQLLTFTVEHLIWSHFYSLMC